MRRILVFPYHPDINTIVEHIDMVRDCSIIGFTSFKEDAGVIRIANEQLRGDDASYDHMISECDAVLLLDNYRSMRPDKYYQVIEDAIKLGKEILITPHACSQLDLAAYYGHYMPLEHLPDGMDRIDNEYRFSRGMKMHSLNSPVIGVFGYGPHCEKFKTQLLLKETLETEYNVAAVSSNALGALFGCYTLPSFLYDNTPYQEKIVRLNYYMKLLENTVQPDVITIGVPEGIAPFQKKEFNHFAEYPLVISSAVSIDLAILCTYLINGEKLNTGIGELIMFCEQKFELDVGAIAIARTFFEIPLEDFSGMIYEYPGKQFLDEQYPDISSIDFPVLNLRSREQSADAIRLCLRQLQDNVRGV